jgi:lipoprotein-releasing system ATP-binding protein
VCFLAHVLDLTGIARLMYVVPRLREAGGAERQRGRGAQAAPRQPLTVGLRLADDPTGNLDTATSASICDLFFEINAARRTTIVVVTHNASFAERMPRIVHLRDGQVEKDLWRGVA